MLIPAEIIRTTCRNRNDYLIDKYGKCFDEHYIDLIIEDVANNLKTMHSKDISDRKKLDIMRLVIARWESNFNSNPSMIFEYGM